MTRYAVAVLLPVVVIVTYNILILKVINTVTRVLINMFHVCLRTVLICFFLVEDLGGRVTIPLTPRIRVLITRTTCGAAKAATL